MKKLLVWGYSFRSLDELEKRRIPIVSLGMVGISENFNSKKTHPDFDFPWCGFVKGEPLLPMPEKVFICLKKIKEVNFDFLPYSFDFFILSERFLNFLKKHGFNYNFDISKAIIVNTKGELLTEEIYYLMRVVIWEIPNEIIYPDLKEDEDNFSLLAYTNSDKDILLSTRHKYLEAFMVAEHLKHEILDTFSLPFLYSLEEWKEQNNSDSYWD